LTDGSKRLEAEIDSYTKEELLEMLAKEEETPFLEAKEQEDGTYAVEEEAA
jgi:hypothetical protein